MCTVCVCSVGTRVRSTYPPRARVPVPTASAGPAGVFSTADSGRHPPQPAPRPRPALRVTDMRGGRCRGDTLHSRAASNWGLFARGDAHPGGLGRGIHACPTGGDPRRLRAQGRAVAEGDPRSLWTPWTAISEPPSRVLAELCQSRHREREGPGLPSRGCGCPIPAGPHWTPQPAGGGRGQSEVPGLRTSRLGRGRAWAPGADRGGGLRPARSRASRRGLRSGPGRGWGSFLGPQTHQGRLGGARFSPGGRGVGLGPGRVALRSARALLPRGEPRERGSNAAPGPVPTLPAPRPWETPLQLAPAADWPGLPPIPACPGPGLTGRPPSPRQRQALGGGEALCRAWPRPDRGLPLLRGGRVATTLSGRCPVPQGLPLLPPSFRLRAAEGAETWVNPCWAHRCHRCPFRSTPGGYPGGGLACALQEAVAPVGAAAVASGLLCQEHPTSPGGLGTGAAGPEGRASLAASSLHCKSPGVQICLPRGWDRVRQVTARLPRGRGWQGALQGALQGPVQG